VIAEIALGTDACAREDVDEGPDAGVPSDLLALDQGLLAGRPESTGGPFERVCIDRALLLVRVGFEVLPACHDMAGSKLGVFEGAPHILPHDAQTEAIQRPEEGDE